MESIKNANIFFLLQIYDTIHELQVLEASSKPAYLFASAATFVDGIDGTKGSDDPIYNSFRLLNICNDLVNVLAQL